MNTDAANANPSTPIRESVGGDSRDAANADDDRRGNGDNASM
jgi:hypothetical protein